MLGREWKGKMHRVAVLPDGFAWNGYSAILSFSKVAFALPACVAMGGHSLIGLARNDG